MDLTHSLASIFTACLLASLLTGCNEKRPERDSFCGSATPLNLAVRAMGEGFQEEITPLTITQQVSGSESPDTATVTIEESGLFDDSIASEKTVFYLGKREGVWTLLSQKKLQRCQSGRGHQDFSDQPCE